MIFGTFFTISAGDITTALGYTGNLIADLMPVLVVFIGLGIAFSIWKNFRK